MIFWLMIILICSLLPLIKKNNILLSISWFILTVSSALRYKVGTDYAQYEYIYTMLATGGETSKELGYYYLFLLSDLLSGNAQTIFIFFSILISSFYYLFVVKSARFFKKEIRYEYSYLMLLLFIAFYYFQSMNQIRQFVAIAIAVYGLLFYVEKRYFLSCFWILLASLFHSSSILLLVFIPFLNIRVNFKIVTVLMAAFIIFNPIEKLISLYVQFKFPYYGYLSYVEFASETSIIGLITTCVSSGFLLFFVYFHKIGNKKVHNIVQNIIIIYVFFRYVALDFEEINRVANYFKPFIFIYISYIGVNSVKRLLSANVVFVISSYSILLLTLLIYIYRSSSDVTYSHYTINYCFISKSICPVVISTNLWN